MATVTSQLPRTKGCPGNAEVSFTTPDGQVRHTRLRAQSSTPPVGQTVAGRRTRLGRLPPGRIGPEVQLDWC